MAVLHLPLAVGPSSVSHLAVRAPVDVFVPVSVRFAVGVREPSSVSVSVPVVETMVVEPSSVSVPVSLWAVRVAMFCDMWH